MVKVNQHKRIFVMTEHQRICAEIFAQNTSVLVVTQTKSNHKAIFASGSTLRCRWYAGYAKTSQ